MSWVIAAVATAVVGSAVYSADKNRKVAHQQQDAARQAADDQAKAQAQSEIDAATAANAQIAENKRRRRSVLGAAGDTLGEPAGGAAGAIRATGSTSATPRGSVLAGGGGSSGGGGTSYSGGTLGSSFPGGSKNWRNENPN
jgi:membrane protein involved in colicin uptake